MMTAGARSLQALALAPMLALGVMGSYFFMLVPVIVSALVHSGIYTSSMAGLIGSAPLAGMFVGSIACAPMVDRLPAKSASAAALLGLVVADCVSSSALRSFPVLLGAQFAAGCSGVVLMSLAFAAISRTSKPDRYFALFIACQMSAGALATQLLERSAVSGGATAVFRILTIAAGCALSLVLLVANAPSTGAIGHRTTPRHPSFGSRSSLAILAAQLCFGAGVMLIWSCVGVIGESRGLDPATVANALSASLVASVAGALWASWVGKWLTVKLALLVGSIAIAGAAVLAVWPPAPGAFYAAVMIFGFGWNFLPPFQLGVAAAIDPSGRLAVLNIALVKLGYALGAAAAGWLAETAPGYIANAAGAILCFAAALATANYSAGAEQPSQEAALPS
jgi:predicted MFS family arabinose efflux permease